MSPPYKSLKQALTCFFDVTRINARSVNLHKTIFTRNTETEHVDTIASVGYYLNQLPENQILLLENKYGKNFSIRKTAQVLKLSPRQVRADLLSAENKLSKKLLKAKLIRRGGFF